MIVTRKGWRCQLQLPRDRTRALILRTSGKYFCMQGGLNVNVMCHFAVENAILHIDVVGGPRPGTGAPGSSAGMRLTFLNGHCSFTPGTSHHGLRAPKPGEYRSKVVNILDPVEMSKKVREILTILYNLLLQESRKFCHMYSNDLIKLYRRKLDHTCMMLISQRICGIWH